MTEPCRTSPAANTPGMLVSSANGRRSSGQPWSSGRSSPVSRNPCAVTRDIRGKPAGVRAGSDQHEERVGGDRLLVAAGCLAQHQLLQTALPSPADHRGSGANVHVRRGPDLPHQVVRHPCLERPSAHDERDATRVAREVQGGLARRVPAPRDEGVLAAQRVGLRGRAAVEDAGAVQRLERGDAQAAVAGAGGEDHRTGPDAPASDSETLSWSPERPSAVALCINTKLAPKTEACS